MSDAYRGDIDGLRAVAVLSVIGFHAFPSKVPGGFIGVDIFFVISGFLISTLIYQRLQDNKFSFLEFYARRIRRIFPALTVVLIACAIAGWFVIFPLDFRSLGWEIGAGAIFVSNFALLQGAGYFDTASDLNPLLHLWSLGIEEQFYLVWPVLLMLCWRRKIAPFVLACTVLAISFAWNIVLSRTDPAAAFYLPMTRFWELMLGCVLAFPFLAGQSRFASRLEDLYRKHRSTAHETAAWLGAALIVSGLIFINRESAFPGWWALLPTAGAALLIVAGPAASLNRRLLGHPALIYVGLISYPLYLWHWPLLSFARILRVGEEPTPLLKAACIAAAFILAHLTYRFIEKPIRFGVPTLTKAVGASIALAAAGSLGLLIYVSGGAAGRFPDNMRSFAKDYRVEAIAAFRGGTCFVGDGEKVSDECDGSKNAELRKVVLWGDSHAAHVFTGLDELAKTTGAFDLAQYTVALCPPIFLFVSRDFKSCVPHNEFVGKKIEALRPDAVIMAANWEKYTNPQGESLISQDAIAATMARLRAAGVRQIFVIGQFPTWKASPQRIRAQMFRARLAGLADNNSPIPERDKAHVRPSVFVINANVERAFAPAGVTFISPLSSLCNDDGCLLVVPNGQGEPTAFDREHLTKPGSIFFATSNAKAILGR